MGPPLVDAGVSNKSVLIIAAHVPPYRSGSGYLRVLKFCDYLPSLGWDPIVLAPRNSAFTERELNPDTAELLRCPTTRAFALDSARHLAIRGRYPDIFAVPDRWSSWWLPAVVAGLRLIRKHRPAALFSTYPIATTHLIGLTLARADRSPLDRGLQGSYDRRTLSATRHSATRSRGYRAGER